MTSRVTLSMTAVLAALVSGTPSEAQTPGERPGDASQLSADTTRPVYLDDRGSGVSTSMFGTYVRKGELLLYPFFEHYRDHDFEYKPDELGFEGDVDYRGRYRANEALFFAAYGVSEDLAVEWEVAVIRAQLDKATADTSSLPARLVESGLGDVEGQVRWRWRQETSTRPELFSYGEVVVPHHEDKPLIGTSGVELKFGTGAIRGYRWGTLTARAAVEYASSSSSPFDVGEYAVEYLRRLSPAFRVFAAIEGAQDELSAIGEVQWHLGSRAFLRLNSGVGLTSKATDWAPEIGLVVSFPAR